MSGTERPDLDAIEARANAATEGPWTSAYEDYGGEMWYGGRGCGIWRIGGPLQCVVAGSDQYEQGEERERSRRRCASDAAFIAHARADVPTLVGYARRLEKALDVARERIGSLSGMLHAETCAGCMGECTADDLAEIDAVMGGS